MDIARRWRQHREAAINNENAPLYLAIRKYGIDNMVPIESITPKVLIDAIVNLESERKTLQNLEKLSKVFQSVERESPSTQVLLSNLT